MKRREFLSKSLQSGAAVVVGSTLVSFSAHEKPDSVLS